MCELSMDPVLHVLDHIFGVLLVVNLLALGPRELPESGCLESRLLLCSSARLLLIGACKLLPLGGKIIPGPTSDPRSPSPRPAFSASLASFCSSSLFCSTAVIP